MIGQKMDASADSRLEKVAVFLMLVVFFLNPFSHTTFLDQLFFYLAIVLMIFMAKKEGRRFYYDTPLFYPFTIFVFWAAVSVGFALDKPDSARDLYSHLIRYLIFYLVVINLFCTKKRLSLFVGSVVFSEFIFAIGGLILYYGVLGHDISSRFFIIEFKSISPDVLPFGFMLGLFLAVWLFRISENKFQRFFLAVVMIVLILSTIATQSRGAALALCVSFPVLLWNQKKILCGFLIAIVIVLLLTPIKDRIKPDQFFQDKARIGLILYTIEIIKDYPIWGTGFSIDAFRNPEFIDEGAYCSRVPEKYRGNRFHRPHNMFLGMASRTGIVGMVLYAWGFAVSIFISFRLMLYGKDSYIRGHARSCLALFIMFLLNGSLQVMTTHFIDMVLFITFSLLTIIWKLNKDMYSQTSKV